MLASSELEFEELSRLYCDHYFDLLGAGWTQVRYGMRCRGLEGHRYDAEAPSDDASALVHAVNHANRQEVARIRALVDASYRPIDWQLDFKSGYRWSERTWYRHVRFGNATGADVKVPWELARMQHLPLLALVYALATDDTQLRLMREFRNQVLDFIAQNPPRFGVNWVTAMDVAIRVSNWLVAYDLFRAYGAKFDDAFERELIASVKAHGVHVFNNLERHGDTRSNHYLADIAGLIFVAAYLPPSQESKHWLRFAAAELRKEVLHQFHEEGSNFEASTSYHRLAAELVVYAAAILRKLGRAGNSDFDDPTNDPAFVQRVAGMAVFSRAVTKPDGNVVQIGDNDSGRFLKLQPSMRQMIVRTARNSFANLQDYNELPEREPYWVENHLDHGATIAAIESLFGVRSNHIDAAVIAGLTAGRALHSPTTKPPATVLGSWEAATAPTAALTPEDVRTFPITTTLHLEWTSYPEFGLYIFRADKFFLSIRCGGSRNEAVGAHAHNDELAVELTVEGVDIFRDPGSYLYTALPARRNEYRSVFAHAAPALPRREPASLEHHAFRLDRVPGECLYFGPRGFIGRHTVFDTPIYRQVEVDVNAVTIKDYNARMHDNPVLPFSPGYGVRCV